MKVAIFLLGILIGMSSSSFAQKVQTAGAMRSVMMGTDLSDHLRWDTLAKAGLYGLSPLHLLGGEVTVIDGKIFVSTVSSTCAITVKETNEPVSAPFGVFTHVTSWYEKKVKAAVSSEENLQKWIEKQAIAVGKSLENPFVFTIKADFDLVGYHIISKDSTIQEHNHELHDLAKKQYSVENTSGELIGFYSRNHEGVFTHKGSFIHIHFIDTAKRQMGHLEEIKWKGKGVLKIGK